MVWRVGDVWKWVRTGYPVSPRDRRARRRVAPLTRHGRRDCRAGGCDDVGGPGVGRFTVRPQPPRPRHSPPPPPTRTPAAAAPLAAPDPLAGAVAGVPCEVAAETAQRNGATLQACELLALVATVRVSVSRFSIVSEAAARAGPPPEKYPRN